MQQDSSHNPAPSQVQPDMPSGASGSPRKPLPKKVLLITCGFLIVLVVVGLGMLMGGSANKSEEKTGEKVLAPTKAFEDIKKTAENSSNAKAASHILVYGSWTGKSSLIKAVNITNSETQLLTTLPLEIKKVSVIDEKTLLYIDQVDKRDHGAMLTVYDIKEKKATASIPAADGFGIDDYTLSPDKKSVALWEVGFAQGAEVLRGGNSRVYTAKLTNPSDKHLLYDEVANKPVHYPRAILDDGTVFSDTFLPNDPNGGAGWAYGMSVASFDGSNKKDIDSMKAGTYGTQPSLSQDGNFLLFSGYDGKYGNGLGVKNGYRQAIITPNTVELLNTKTLQRTSLPNLPNNDSYATSQWDFITGKIILSIVGAKAEKTGLYAYDPASNSLEKISIPQIENTEFMHMAGLPKNQMLVGSIEEKASTLGNLGPNYEYAYSKLASFDSQSSQSSALALEDTYVQYITILPAEYFKAVLGINTSAQANPQPTFINQYSNQNASKEKLQLYTFFVKYDLLKTRTSQQSNPLPLTNLPDLTKISLSPNTTTTNTVTFNSGDIPSSSTNIPSNNVPINKVPEEDQPKCNDVTAQVCAEKGQGPETKEYTMCKGMYKSQNMSRTCDDSPLYLYGQSGKKVNVTINTPVYNAIPSYVNGYDVTLGANGRMQIGGTTYERIAYDYASNLRIRKAPKEGIVTARSDVAGILKYYANKLGLNEKETADLVKAGRQKITSPYAFISFYDHQTSHQILPISFTPAPDTYLNVVFYFKLLETKPAYTPVAPAFPEPLRRAGFTAVEVSEVVE